MTHQEIRDGNELMNNLMGSTIKIHQDDVKDIPLAFLKPEDLKFHLAWKWLMPVVIKIEEDLGHTVRIEGKTCAVIVDEEQIFESEAETKMEAVWASLVDFLSWNKENG